MNKFRMYGLVNYQFTGIQKGIQFTHAVVEYGLKYFNDIEYKQWANYDKTIILLNGGTTNTNINSLGTMNFHHITLNDIGVKNTTFYEPDIGDQLTAIAFILDDRVFDYEKYPNYDDNLLQNFDPKIFQSNSYINWTNQFNDSEENVDRIVKLRDFISKFKLA